MSRIINIDAELRGILKNYWQLDYNNLYLELNNIYSIRITKDKGIVWFEVDQEPLLDECYIFASQCLKETLDWCYDTLDIDLMYY